MKSKNAAKGGNDMTASLTKTLFRAWIVLLTLACLCLIPIRTAEAETHTVKNEFSFSYPQGWSFSTTAFKHTSRGNYFWLCMANSKESALAATKYEDHAKYGFLSLKEAAEEKSEEIKKYLAYGPGGTYLETLRSDADGTPFFLYSFRGIANSDVYYEAKTLINGWVIVFQAYQNEPIKTRSDATADDLRVLKNAVRSFRSLYTPLPREGDYGYTIQNNKVTVGSYFGNDLEPAIPAVIAGFPVTCIGDHAFSGCTAITGVTLPESITTIEDYAFSNCESLKSITIPHGVKKIPDYAFYFCSGLKEIFLSDTVTLLGKSAFFSCRGLEGITLPPALTGIGDEAFYGCGSLRSITIPTPVQSIGDGAFEMCRGLTEIRVDSGNKSFKDVDGILYDKSGKKLLSCPDGRAGAIEIPQGVSEIARKAFSYCGKITQVTMRQGVKRIEDGAFSSCHKLERADIPMSVTYIADSALDYLKLLTIYSYEGSAAEKYAKKMEIPFAAIEKAGEIILQAGEMQVNSVTLLIDMASEAPPCIRLSASILPDAARQEFIWKSSDAKVATVNDEGLVTGYKKGTATITATAADGSKVTASLKVSVTFLAKEIRITGNNTVKSGRQTTLKAVVLPAETANKKVTWASSDESTATVSASGAVVAKKMTEEKTVTITAFAKDGSGVSAEFVITVTP